MNSNPSEIIKSFANELERIGYGERTLLQYQSIFKELLSYCSQHGIIQYSSSVGEMFLKEAFHDVKFNKSTTRKASTYIRVINMLSYFAENGTVPFRFKRSDYQFPIWFQPVYEKFLAYRKYQGIVDRTIHKQHCYFEKFAAYLNNNGIDSIQKINMAILENYVASLSIFSLSVRYNTVLALRMFLLFLYENGYVATNYKDTIPNVKYSHKSTILSVYSPEEIERLLECVDRGNATGKRDYAIFSWLHV
ncbi:hypothetical protein [Acutalibacter intestini]|uniref:hypothetical protein n=1 Tax=Acutalibacter intestini TaxID=3093659 RepID=UPI002AC907B5|nr:hypothetical protein [Acutalibacter sp. M00204]